MAIDKKSAVIYTDWINIFEELEDIEAGQLIKHLFRYINDKNPVAPSRLIKLVFEPLKLSLKRDLVKYESKRLKNTENANKRWHNNNATACDGIKSDANHAVSVSDSVTVSVTVPVINNKSIQDDFLAKIIGCFKDSYSRHKNDEYTVTAIGKEKKAAGGILKLYKSKYPESNSEETLRGLSAFFDQCCNLKNDWIRNNLSLSTILLKFNEIKLELNGKTLKSAPKATNIGAIVDATFVRV